MSEITATIAERNGLTKENIDWVIPHQANMRIIDAVAEHFSVSREEVFSKRRSAAVVLPRQYAMYLCRELTLKSTNEIGAAFYRTHATILNAEKRVEELCEKDENIRRSVNQLRHEIKKNS